MEVVIILMALVTLTLIMGVILLFLTTLVFYATVLVKFMYSIADEMKKFTIGKLIKKLLCL